MCNISLYRTRYISAHLLVLLVLLNACSRIADTPPQTPTPSSIAVDDIATIPLIEQSHSVQVSQERVIESRPSLEVTYTTHKITFVSPQEGNDVLTYYDTAIADLGWNEVCVLRPLVTDPPVTRLPTQDAQSCGVTYGGPFQADFTGHRIYTHPEQNEHMTLIIQPVEQEWQVTIYVFDIEQMISSRSLDLHAKFRDYQKYGVREYLVLIPGQQDFVWYDLAQAREIPLPADCVLRSQQFPGFWLSVDAILNRDHAASLKVLEQGLATPEHQVFVQLLQGRATPGRADAVN